MNKQEALHLVASHVAGNLMAGSIEEATGIYWHEVEQMSDADRLRLADAMEEVARRLYRMGKQPADA